MRGSLAIASPRRRHRRWRSGCWRVAALASPAGALTARFTLNGGAAYSRRLRVTAGDGG